MPADFELQAATRMVRSRGWGALSDADVLDHVLRLVELFRSGVLGPEWAQIYDFTGVEHLRGITAAGVRSVAAHNPWPQACIRVVIATTDEQYGLLRMYQALGDPQTDGVRIARSVAEAEAWIAGERARLGIVW